MVVIRLIGAVGVAAAAAAWIAPLAGAQQPKASAVGGAAKSRSAAEGSSRSALALGDEPTLLGTYGDWGRPSG